MEKQKSFFEVVNSEKQMLALIYSKNILHDDVLELYCKIRSGYEEMLLNNNQLVERQEVEYHLWKLHYELIDAFRKKIRQRSLNAENMTNSNPNSQINNDKGLEGFKSFLSEATDFYKKLIVKLRKRCGLPGEIFLNNKDYRSFNVEPIKLHACEHTCHRLLICVGDLARYTEMGKKPDACEWSTAARYYLEATRTWPDSGNPHNQLALLATYVGDAFLALYHCVRSLAVKERFPDAWRNILLLFEENRCVKLPSVSSHIQLDLLNPSKRSYVQSTHHEENRSPHNTKLEDLENVSSEKIDLWPVFVRTISFLLIRSSLEEFQRVLAIAVHNLEALLAVDDRKLTAILESYRHMDSSKRGPYRAIQLVSTFIFTIHTLTSSAEREDSTDKDDQKQVFTPLAFAAIFIFMGRITERCLNGNNHGDICPLLPAVLVFLEWMEEAVDTVEKHNADARVANALSYFFGRLAELLDQIKGNQNWTDLDYAALWEDHELRGFYPLIRVHEKMDFTTHLECMENYKSRNKFRFHRIFRAATRIMDMLKSDKVVRRYKSMKTVRFSDQVEVEITESLSGHERNEPDEQADRSLKDDEKPLTEEIVGPKTQQTSEDQEEIILFKPITRRNSAPLYISKPTEGPTCLKTQTYSHEDESLRRAMSLSACQTTEDHSSDSFSFCLTPPKQKEPTGPPSLSGWVLSKARSPHTESNFNRQKLSPVEEITDPTSFFDLSINETTKDKSEVVATGHISTIVHDSSSPRATPTPSAPLLPDDAYWLRGNNNNNSLGNEANRILGAGPISGYPTRLGVSGLVDGYPPFLGMSSSEWLYHYRNGQNMNNIAGNHQHLLAPVHLSSNIPAPTFGSFHANDISGFNLWDQWGNHCVSSSMLYPQMYPDLGIGYGYEGLKRDNNKLFLGYQRPFPYVCGVGMELSPEQAPLLQYLKEKERQLQPGSQLRGPPTFMGN